MLAICYRGLESPQSLSIAALTGQLQNVLARFNKITAFYLN